MAKRYQVLLTVAQREAVQAALSSTLAGPIDASTGFSQRAETFDAAADAVARAKLIEVPDAR